MSTTADFTKYIVEAIQSDGQLYRSQGRPIVLNLARKKIKGVYQAALAAKLYTYLAESGIKKFKKEFCEYYEVSPSAVSRIPASVKLTIAKALLRDAMPEILYAVRELKEAAAKKKKPVQEEPVMASTIRTPRFINYRGREYERCAHCTTKATAGLAARICRKHGANVVIRPHNVNTRANARFSTLYIVYTRIRGMHK